MSHDPLDGFHITLGSIFSQNQDVIKIYNDENINFFYRDFVDVTLKASSGIRKTKKYNLVLEIAVSCLESYFPLIFFSNSHSMICIC